ncbi:hypothetical protein GCM10009757_04290 [Streptomyces cheonanensis]|uniref:Uncharacterized protein n=1 Tax=Streptomyces cheonanensis TaxID=312720 RepID=A0ABN2URM6_9ACTN
MRTDEDGPEQVRAGDERGAPDRPDPGAERRGRPERMTTGPFRARNGPFLSGQDRSGVSKLAK